MKSLRASTGFAQGGMGAAGGMHDLFEALREDALAVAPDVAVPWRCLRKRIFGDGFAQEGGERGGRGRGSDLRYDMRITFEEAARGVEKEIEIAKLQSCEKCDGSGAEPGSKVTTCPTCGGQGQVAVARGFFNIAQTCPRCRGAGQTIEKPCHTCRR